MGFCRMPLFGAACCLPVSAGDNGVLAVFKGLNLFPTRDCLIVISSRDLALCAPHPWGGGSCTIGMQIRLEDSLACLQAGGRGV